MTKNVAPKSVSGPRREDRVVDAELLAAERDLGALGAPDPVALHRLDVLGPLDRVEVVQAAGRRSR
jgi:hypothetical protein